MLFQFDDGIVVVEGSAPLEVPVSTSYRDPWKFKREGTMTTAEYLDTPETVLPRELAFGVLRVADSPIVAHQRVVRELTVALTLVVRERGSGEVIPAPMDVVLDYDAALVVQPDVLYVSAERAGIARERIYGAPDVVVEVLSPRPRIGQLHERMSWFCTYGVRECWLVDVMRREVAVLTLGARSPVGRRLFAGNEAIVSDVLGELPITPASLFPSEY